MLEHFGKNFELVQIEEMGVKGAFDEAVKGVDGIAHLASSTNFRPDPNEVIPGMVQSAIGVLEAASKEPNVKSVVYTSSQGAAVHLEPNVPYHITTASFNETSKVAWTLPPSSDFPRMILNYLCAKTESEQACAKWVEDNKPHFTYNCVVPNINFGTMVRPDKLGFSSSSALLKALWDGSTAPANMIPPEWYVDVEDAALLHLAVLTLPDVKNERVFAFGQRYCYKDILKIFKKEVPGREFLDTIEEVEDCGTVDNARAEALLKRVGKKEGFSTLEEGIKKWIQIMLEVEKSDLKVESEHEKLAKSVEGDPGFYEEFGKLDKS
jgi:nucleoside-diphosphate-sugar epimerase